METLSTEFVAACITVVLTLLAQKFLGEPLQALAFKVPWIKSKRASCISGIWVARYDFHECGDISCHKEIWGLYEIIELPLHIILIRDITAKDRPAIIKGRRDLLGYLTGTYENSDSNDILHGAYQLKIAARGKTMYGRFIGFSEKNGDYINHGDWYWYRVNHVRTSAARDLAVKNYESDLKSVASTAFEELIS